MKVKYPWAKRSLAQLMLHTVNPASLPAQEALSTGKRAVKKCGQKPEEKPDSSDWG